MSASRRPWSRSGMQLGVALIGVVAVPVGTATTRLDAVRAQTPTPETFEYSGRLQTRTVPEGIRVLTIEAAGARRGDATTGSARGRGVSMQGDVVATSGDVFAILDDGSGTNTCLGVITARPSPPGLITSCQSQS